jgi:hypothetical protein
MPIAPVKLRLDWLEERVVPTAESEPNDTAAQADSFNTPNDTLTGAIGSGSDIDFFRTNLAHGDVFTVNLNGDPGDLRIAPAAEIHDPDGRVIAASLDGRPMTVVAAEAGTYRLRLFAGQVFGNFVADYSVRTSVTTFGGTSESEPNDSAATATAAGTFATFRGSLASGSDADYFSFSGSAGRLVTIKFAGRPADNPAVRLFNSSGVEIASGLNGFGLSAVLPANGNYTFAVRGDNTSGGVTGQYVGDVIVLTATAEAEPGNGFEGATPWNVTTSNSRMAGTLSSTSDVDVFAVAFSSPGTYFAWFDSPNSQVSTQGRELTLYNEFGQRLNYSNRTSGLNALVWTSRAYLTVRATNEVGLGAYSLEGRVNAWPTQRDVPLYFFDFTGQATHHGYGPASPLDAAARTPAIALFEAQFDIYDVDVTQARPASDVENIAIGVGGFGNTPYFGQGGGSYGNRRGTGDAYINTTSGAGSSLAAFGITTGINHELAHATTLPHSRHPLSYLAYDRVGSLNPVGSLFPFPWTDQRVPSTNVLNQRAHFDWVLQAGRITPEAEPNNSPALAQNLDPFLDEMTGDADARNDRVAITGRIDISTDVDVYKITAAANETFIFDIDAAEFQQPLDAVISIYNSGGTLLASNQDALDRDSGLFSVDPYLRHQFSSAGVYTIEVKGQFGSVGEYRFKVTADQAFDSDGPRVLAVGPDGGATVDGTRQIVVWFNDQIDPATLNSTNVVVTGASNGTRSGTVTFDPMDATLIWLADSALPADTYTVTLRSGSTGIKDLLGNQLNGETDGSFAWPERSGNGSNGGNFSFTFTVSGPDTTAAALTSSNYREHPSNRGLFELNFDDHIDVQSLYASGLNVRYAGADGSFNTGDDAIVPADLYWNKVIYSMPLALNRVSAFVRGTPDAGNYRVEGSFRDAAGNTVNVSETFTVGASALSHGPVVTDVSIQPDTIIGTGTNSATVTFGSAIQSSSLTTSSFRLRYSADRTFFDGNDSYVADADGTIAWDAVNRRATFQAASAFTLGHYLIELDGDPGGIRDPNGRLLDGEFLDSNIQGNTQPWLWKDSPSGDGLPGGDYVAYFQVADLAGNINDAPILDNTGDMVLDPIAEDDTANPGTRIVDLIASAGGDRITDPDPGALEGIAIVAANTTSGSWQFSTNNGGSWSDLGSVSGASARLLAADSTTRIRFVPAANFAGTVPTAITFRAWDRTSGSNGGTANTNVNGGTTAFSVATETASITVNPTNDAPVLDNTGSMSLADTLEDSAGDNGTLIVDLIASAGGDRITDPDAGALEGIAIIAADTANGAWHYSINNGSSWSALGAVSDSSARLLAADSATRVRFIPVANFFGTINNALTFRAWDQTSGSNGSTGNAGVNGGSTAFSTATETAVLTITPVNDAPSFTKGADQSVNEDAGPQTVPNWATNLSPGPPNETGQALSFLVTTNNDALFGVLPAVSSTGTLTYTTATNANGTATVSVRIKDDGGTANGGQDTSTAQTFTITVNPVNDAPVVTAASPNLSPVLEDAANPPGQRTDSFLDATDPDAGALKGIAVIGLGNAEGGTWYYSLDGSSWTAFGSVSSSAARLLRGSDQVRFIPALNANGTATITYHAWDQTTGTAGATVSLTPGSTGGTTAYSTGIQTANLAITPVNDPPSFTKGPDQSVLEDAGPQQVSNWATNLSPGPPNESGQTLTFEVTNNTNPGLFSAVPAVNSAGTLMFTTASNANGSATITIRVRDSGGTTNGGVDVSPTQSFTITVTPVNDPPSFTRGSNIRIMQENPPPQTFAGWATNISPGPPDEAGQSVAFEVVGNTDPSLFVVPPAISPGGTLTFTPAADVHGYSIITVRLKDTGGTANGGVDTSAEQSFWIGVNPINQAPSFTVGSNQTVLEDAGTQTRPGWAVNMNPGSTFESDQLLWFEIVSNTNPGLFSSQPAVDADGTLTYRPAANANGMATIEIVLRDDGGTMFGGVDTSPPQTFTITVTPVNDRPSFTKGPNQTVLEDSGPRTVSAWATGISPGPPDEASQAITFEITGNSNPALFAALPAVASDGTLTFTPADNAVGTATVTLRAVDDGGTDNGGLNASLTQSFTITVIPVNDAPTFSKGANRSVAEDSGPHTTPGWATMIVPGPPDESSQGLSFAVSTDNDALFAALPAIAPDGTLTFTPAVDAFGSAEVTVQLQDNGGTANGGQDTSPPQSFVIEIRPVNDVPSFLRGGDQTVDEDAGPQLVSGWATGLSAGPPNEAGQQLSFETITNSNPALFAAGPHVAPNGALSFTPAADANGTATISLRVVDDGGTVDGGVDASASQSFTITLRPVNDAPVPGSDTVTAVVGKSLRIPVLLNDTDVDQDQLRLVSITSPANGSARREGNFVIYRTRLATAGTDSFTYTVSDGNGGTATGTVSINVVDNLAPRIQSFRLYYGPTAYVDARSLSRGILPWEQITRIAVVFSEGVVVDASALTATGLAGAHSLSFSYDPATRTATWTPLTPILGGRLTIRLAAAGVVDGSGNALANNFARSVGLLAGDFDGNGVVNDTDVRAIQKRLTRPAASRMSFADVDGNGIVDQADLDKAAANKGRRLR